MKEHPITLLKTDITLLSTDAIVNAANEGLWGGGGGADAGVRAAGKVCDSCGRSAVAGRPARGAGASL